MKPQARTNYGNFDDHLVDAEGLEETFGSRFQLKRLAET
jgi:hypothetical protein